MLELIILFIFSFIANTLSAFSGGGAGLIQFPVLIFLGLSFGTALATHKIASVALGVGATFRYIKENLVERKFALFILATGLPGVILGANIILHIPDRIAEINLGLLTMGLGIYSIFKKQFGQQYTPLNRTLKGHIIGAIVLFIIGFLNGSLTSGTGLFATIWLIRWFGLDYKRAVAYTLILVGFFWNGTGAIILSILGNVQWNWLPILLIGSLLGGYTGAHLAILKGSLWIKRGFEIVTLGVGFKLILG